MERKRSKLWTYFSQVSSDKAKCDLCQVKYSFKGGSTTNLKKNIYLFVKHRASHDSLFSTEPLLSLSLSHQVNNNNESVASNPQMSQCVSIKRQTDLLRVSTGIPTLNLMDPLLHTKDTKEWVIVEVQGDLESNTGGSVAGKTFGQLFFVKDKPILIIGYSILYGKIMDNNPNIAVLQKHKHYSENTSVSSSSEKRTSYSLLALVKKRIVFRSRPKPIVTSESTTC